MKKYILSALGLLMLGITACNKFDIAPKDEIYDKERAYKDNMIRSQILAGIYSLLYNEATWGAFIPIRLEAGTDVALSRSTSTGTPENDSHTPQSSMVSQNWTVLFQAVNASNEFLYYSDLYTPDSSTKTQQQAEARFLRAYFYFTLVRLYGDVPFRTEPVFDLNNTDIARTSAAVIYDFIVKELVQAQADLGDPSSVTYGHIGKTAAQAALADVYLNLAGKNMINRLPADSTAQRMHKQAAYWCEQVLANPAHDITKTAYKDVFLNQVREVSNVAEQIWELQPKYMIDQGYRSDSRLGKYNGMGDTRAGEYSANAMIYQSATLRGLYGKVSPDDANNQTPDKTDPSTLVPDKDERAAWNAPWTKYDKNTNTWAKPVEVEINKDHLNLMQLFPGKWRTIYSRNKSESSDLNYSGTRLSIYRIADVHLMYAEAINEGNNDQSGALAQVNIVRGRANATLAPVSPMPTKQQMFDLIVDERARELCFEGKRRFDLIRWGLHEKKLKETRVPYDNPVNPVWIYGGTASVFGNFNPAMHDILPVPQSEISRNSLIPQSEQNQGWGGNRVWK